MFKCITSNSINLVVGNPFHRDASHIPITEADHIRIFPFEDQAKILVWVNPDISLLLLHH
jgi:hypothetical protein